VAGLDGRRQTNDTKNTHAEVKLRPS
jgi:hypothetical protein